MKPMLAKPVDTERFLRLLEDDAWSGCQKVDGHRAIISLSEGKAFTRTGQSFDRLTRHAELFSELDYHDGARAWLDGEYLPDQKELWLFDFYVEGAGHAFDERQGLLQRYSTVANIVPTFTDWRAKAELTKQLLATRREGVMLKRRSSKYVEKRSENWLKYKFMRSAECVVTNLSIDGRANMELSLYFNDGLRPVAECSALTGDGPRVRIGQVVEVSYLYATEDNRLYQPVTPRIRLDKRPEECTSDQLIPTDKSVLRLP